MSYLDFPRLNFRGYFQADVSTVNNTLTNYDIQTFSDQNGELGWNAAGTGAFRLIDCAITGGCLAGHPISATDPLIGMTLQNADQRVSGKLVDLDPQQQMVSQIWGMTVRLAGDGNLALFSGEYEPAAFINLWKRQQEKTADNDQLLGALYQSVLHNVSWNDTSGSPLLEALRLASQDRGLSINMNVYGYGRDPNIPRYTIGHINGSIGPSHANEPKHFVVGRQMIAALKPNLAAKHDVNTFTCKVHEKEQIISADFGNAIPVLNANSGLKDIGTLTLALGIAAGANDNILTSVTPAQVQILGDVNYQQKDWYTTTAGIQDFYYGDKPAAVANINNAPLLLLGAESNGTYPVLVQESLGGLYVRSDNFVYRLNPGASEPVDLYASQYGQPLSATVAVAMTEGQMDNEIPICTPANAISFPSSIQTDSNGKAQFPVTASNAGPGVPRGYIEGQLYGISYALSQQPADYISNMWNYISLLAFSLTETVAQPTWYQNVWPTFTQYANLYPIMSKHLVHLGDYNSVIEHLPILNLAFSLPVSNPNYMPVTRDLSDSLRSVILQWMNTPGADGKPLKGTPPPIPTPPAAASHATTVLATDSLQTAGKTSFMQKKAARQQAGKGQPS